MAQKLPSAGRGDDDAPEPPSLDSRQVAEAVLHLARLAAAHAQWGVTFVDSETLEKYPVDKRALRTLEEVTRVLLEDRERLRDKVGNALLSRIHRIIADAFKGLAKDADCDASKRLGEEIAAKLKVEFGFTVSPHEMKRLAVKPAFIRLRGGPVEAAATALGTLVSGAPRSVRRWIDEANATGQTAGPLNRWVPMRDLRAYLERVLKFATDQRQESPSLPLSSLRGGDHIEALLERVELRFRANVRRGIDASRDAARELFRSLARGEDPFQGDAISDSFEKHWSSVRDLLAARRAQLARHDTEDGSPADEADAAAAKPDAIIEKLVTDVLNLLRDAFDVGDASSPPGTAGSA